MTRQKNRSTKNQTLHVLNNAFSQTVSRYHAIAFRNLLVHVFHVVDRDEGVIDSDNVDVGLVGSRAHHKTVKERH